MPRLQLAPGHGFSDRLVGYAESTLRALVAPDGMEVDHQATAPWGATVPSPEPEVEMAPHYVKRHLAEWKSAYYRHPLYDSPH